MTNSRKLYIFYYYILKFEYISSFFGVENFLSLIAGEDLHIFTKKRICQQKKRKGEIKMEKKVTINGLKLHGAPAVPLLNM